MSQSGASLALPRVRARRRWRPPSSRQVWWLLIFATLLGYIAHAVIDALRGSSPFWSLLAAGWIGAYLLWWRRYQRERRLEESQDAAPPPIRRDDWTWLAVFAGLQTLDWMDLIAGLG